MPEPRIRRLFRLFFKLLSYRPPEVAVPAQGAVLEGVTVVNPGAGRQAGQRLVVEGGRIAAIEPGAPGGEYAGCTVLPGLVDMHVHITPSLRELVEMLFLAHGVTTVREAGDADGTTWAARRQIDAGRRPGPRTFACGPVLDGAPPFLPTSWPLRTAAEAEAAVDVVAAQGADFVKIHHYISAEALDGVRRAAAAHGLRVVGHAPMAVPFDECGVWDVQHLDGVIPYPGPDESPLDYQLRWQALDPARIDAYVRTSVEQGMAHTPTLVTTAGFVRLLDPQAGQEPALRLLPRYYRDVIWRRQRGPSIFRRFTDQALARMAERQSLQGEIVRRLHAAGVRVHLGSDTAAAPFVVPGLSLQQELACMVAAGLTLDEAWVAGTRAAGESLGLAGLGVLRAGAPADLLVFGGDPSRDLAALGSLRAVVAQGRLYPRAVLEAALTAHRRCFERPSYDRLTTGLMRWMVRAAP